MFSCLWSVWNILLSSYGTSYMISSFKSLNVWITILTFKFHNTFLKLTLFSFIETQFCFCSSLFFKKWPQFVFISFFSIYRPGDRTGEDLDLIYCRLKEIQAFDKFHPMLLHQICIVGYYEDLEKGVTCKFLHYFIVELTTFPKPKATYVYFVIILKWNLRKFIKKCVCKYVT